VTVPGTELLDVILTRNVTTKRCKNEFLLVQAAAELVKLEARHRVLVKVFLGSVHQRLFSQFIGANLQLRRNTWVSQNWILQNLQTRNCNYRTKYIKISAI